VVGPEKKGPAKTVFSEKVIGMSGNGPRINVSGVGDYQAEKFTLGRGMELGNLSGTKRVLEALKD
jgi:hypothetical protein